jgi:hypothetical protein
MPFSALSFLIGLGAGCALPAISRSFRPLAVEAAAFGMGFFEDARRFVAEQMENLEDIAAEARARREQIVASADGDADADVADVEPEEEDAEGPDEPAVNGRGRRRAARGRSRAS